MNDASEQPDEKPNELAGMQFASVELNLNDVKTGTISHFDDETGSETGLGELANFGAEGFCLVSVTPKENGRAVAFLQRQVQTERELNFIRNAFLLEDILQIDVEDLPKVVGSIEIDDLIVALKPASDCFPTRFHGITGGLSRWQPRFAIRPAMRSSAAC